MINIDACASTGEECPTVKCLNEAFRRDPNAIMALVINRIPCNKDLADDEFVIVATLPTLPDVEMFQVGAIGLLNGVLVANGLPKVAVKYSKADETGRSRVLGFCQYQEPVEGEK